MHCTNHVRLCSKQLEAGDDWEMHIGKDVKHELGQELVLDGAGSMTPCGNETGKDTKKQ